MRFSLILCTVNRTEEVEDLLKSLLNQLFASFEIIIVDQNNDDRILRIIESFSSLKIKYLRTKIGLSKARNIGLKNAIGDIVCFPDDDCIYPQELLYNVNRFFNENKYNILMGKTIDRKTGKVVAGNNILGEKKLSTLYTLGSSTTLFIRNNIQIFFDERFGLGSIFGSEEENELVFRLLKKGYKGYYNPTIDFVYHPPSDIDFTDIQRIQQRSIGLGAFIAKYLFSIEGIIYFSKYALVRPLSAGLLYLFKLDTIKSKYYFSKLLGIWMGFFKYFRYKNETNF